MMEAYWISQSGSQRIHIVITFRFLFSYITVYLLKKSNKVIQHKPVKEFGNR